MWEKSCNISEFGKSEALPNASLWKSEAFSKVKAFSLWKVNLYCMFKWTYITSEHTDAVYVQSLELYNYSNNGTPEIPFLWI